MRTAKPRVRTSSKPPRADAAGVSRKPLFALLDDERPVDVVEGFGPSAYQCHTVRNGHREKLQPGVSFSRSMNRQTVWV